VTAGTGETGGGSFKRRTWVIERRAQVRVALWVLLHLAACLALTLLLVLLPTLLRFFSGELPLERQLEAGREHLYLGGPVAGAVVAMLVVVVLNSIALTNRIFGPLARLKRVLRRWRDEGAWPPAVRVRKRDFHAELFEEVSAAVAAVGADVAAARDHLQRAEERARGLGARLGPGDDREGASAIAEECRQAQQLLERWKARQQ